jgi:hypothetical protein
LFVFGFALGALFGWLLEQVARVWKSVWKRIAHCAPLANFFRFIAWCVLLGVFLTGVYILALADYDVENSYAPSRLLPVYHFITAPRQLTTLPGILFGWLCFAYRKWILSVLQTLNVTSAAPTKSAEALQNGATNGSDGQNGNSWLSSGVAVAAIGVVALIGLAVMQPQLFSHLTSLKFGSVIEANFTAAAEHSVRVNAPSFGGYLTARQLLERGSELPEVIQDIYVPVSNRLNAELEDSEKRKQDDQYAFILLEVFAVPLAQVVKCYMQEFPVGDTEVLHEAVVVADYWRRMAKGDDDPLGESPNKGGMTNYDALEKMSTHLLLQISGKLPAGLKIDPGEFTVYKEAEKGSCDLRRREPPLDSQEPSDWHQAISGNIKRILKNGIVISFIANMVAFTQSFETAATFLESMDKASDKEPGLEKGSVLGRYYFYSNRALSKYFANWYPPESTKRDFNEARSDMNSILAAITNQSGGGSGMSSARTYFEEENARMLNNRLYYLLTESLQGRPLLQAEIDEVRTLAAELKGWIDRQPAVPDWIDRSGVVGLVDKRRAHLIPPFFDTLATEQIVMIQLGRNSREGGCEKVRTYLDKAQELFAALAVKTSEEAHRDDFKVIAARRDMYESICGQNQ